MKDEQKKVCDEDKMIDIGACKIHPAHTGLKKSLGRIAVPIEQLLVCHNTFFKLSSVRRDRLADTFEELNLKIKFLLNFVATRWLGAKPCADRIVENHEAMVLFIQQYKDENKNIADNPVYKVLEDFYSEEKKEANKCRMKFVSFLGNKYGVFLGKLQTENPYACFIYKEIRKLVQNLIDIVSRAKLPNDNVDKFDLSKAISDNKRHNPDYGVLLNEALDKLPTINRRAVREELREAVIEGIKYLVKSLGFNIPELKWLTSFDPGERKEKNTKMNINKIAKVLGRFNTTEINDLDNEVDAYINIQDSKLPKFFPSEMRLDRDYYNLVYPLMANNLGREPEIFKR